MTRRDVLIQALATTPNDLRLLSAGADDAAARHRTAPEAWSALDVISHLLAIEKPYRERLERVVREDRPHVPYIHPDENSHPLQRSLADILAEFAAARRQTLDFLEALAPADWQRVAIHERKGPMSLRYLVQDLVAHDIDHTNQLAETLQRRQTTGRSFG